MIIEKLEEYKLSIITEAVTSGINPDVEMKDSGHDTRVMEEAQPEQHRLLRYLSIISICRSQQLSLILLMADAGMIIPIGRMYLNTVKMAVFRQ